MLYCTNPCIPRILGGTVWKARQWLEMIQVLLTTQMAVKVAERATWFFVGYCKPVPEPGGKTTNYSR